MSIVCPERIASDGKHEWMPFRWVKESSGYQSVAGYVPTDSLSTVMKLGEVVCKYCLERKML